MADRLLYGAKESGRDRIILKKVVYNGEVEDIYTMKEGNNMTIVSPEENRRLLKEARKARKQRRKNDAQYLRERAKELRELKKKKV